MAESPDTLGDPLNLIQVMLAEGRALSMPVCLSTAFPGRKRCVLHSLSTIISQPSTKSMIATKDSFEPHSSEQLPNKQTRLCTRARCIRSVRVPMREIELTPTKTYSGAVEANEPVRVYDCSGPWGDPDFTGNSNEGLPALRAKWIEARGDVTAYGGREVTPMDNGYLSGKHAEYASKAEKNRLVEFPGLIGQRRQPLRASQGHPVTQLWYARQGIITPEMEFIAIRENMGQGEEFRVPGSGVPG